MKTKLGAIATVQTGLFANNFADGDVVYLQAKHFNEFGILKSNLHPDLKKDEIEKKHLLQQGDVIFAAKGTKNFAAVFNRDKFDCVASTSFFVIRLTNKSVLLEYIAWYLNHPKTQKILKSKAIGSSIVSISKQVLSDLEIPIPEIKIQQSIISISYLRNKEKELIRKISELREQLIQQQIIHAIK